MYFAYACASFNRYNNSNAKPREAKKTGLHATNAFIRGARNHRYLKNISISQHDENNINTEARGLLNSKPSSSRHLQTSLRMIMSRKHETFE